MNPIDHQMRTLKLLGIHNIDKTPEVYSCANDIIWVNTFLKSNWVKKGNLLYA